MVCAILLPAVAKRARRTRSVHSEPEQSFSDPRLSWLATHRLPAEQPNIKRPESILATDQALWALEFEFYVTPLLNRAAWAAYREAAELVIDQGLEESELLKPRCPIPVGWIPEARILDHQLIGDLTLPRMDQVTDRFVVTDWEELAAWKADMEVAVGRLTGEEQQIYRLLQRGATIGEIARRFGVAITVTINAIRGMNGKLRQQLRVA